MVEEALARVEVIQKHQEAVMAASYYVNYRKPHLQVVAGNLLDHLNALELDEWRNVFMWALTVTDAERDRIKAAAQERFLSDKMHVAQWFHDGTTPGKWLVADEEEFRAMVKEVFAPKA